MKYKGWATVIGVVTAICLPLTVLAQYNNSSGQPLRSILPGVGTTVGVDLKSELQSGTICPAANGGTGLATSGTDSAKYLNSDGSGGWQLGTPSSSYTLPAFSTTGTTRGGVIGSNSVGATYYLDGTDTWSIPAGTYSLPAFSTTGTTRGGVPGSNNLGAAYFLDGSGNWSTPILSASVTSVPGSSTGHYRWSQPQTGTGSKKVIIVLDGLTDGGGGTIVFPTAFVYQPGIMASVDTATQACASASSTTTTTFTLGASTAATGTITLEGF